MSQIQAQPHATNARQVNFCQHKEMMLNLTATYALKACILLGEELPYAKTALLANICRPEEMTKNQIALYVLLANTRRALGQYPFWGA